MRRNTVEWWESMFLPSQLAHKHMQKCHEESRRVFSNVSPPHDVDIADLLVKSVDDTQLGGLSNALDDRIRIQKIRTGRTDELQFRRLNLIGINVNSCAWVQKKSNCLLSYSHPLHSPRSSLGDLFKIQIRSCHFLAENPLRASYCLPDKDKTHYVVLEILHDWLLPFSFTWSLTSLPFMLSTSAVWKIFGSCIWDLFVGFHVSSVLVLTSCFPTRLQVSTPSGKPSM